MCENYFPAAGAANKKPKRAGCKNKTTTETLSKLAQKVFVLPFFSGQECVCVYE